MRRGRSAKARLKLGTNLYGARARAASGAIGARNEGRRERSQSRDILTKTCVTVGRFWRENLERKAEFTGAVDVADPAVVYGGHGLEIERGKLDSSRPRRYGNGRAAPMHDPCELRAICTLWRAGRVGVPVTRPSVHGAPTCRNPCALPRGSKITIHKNERSEPRKRTDFHGNECDGRLRAIRRASLFVSADQRYRRFRGSIL